MVSRISHTTVDCRDAYGLSEWWKDVLGYGDIPGDPNEPGHEECMIVDPLSGHRLLFIEVPEAKAVKNRLHVDLVPAAGSRDAEVERVTALGAGVVADLRRPDGTGWVVLADPEGNEFCVLRSDAERAEGTLPSMVRSGLTPYIAVSDAGAALRWYGEVFGAAQTQPPIVMPDGRVGHAAISLSGSELFLSDAHPEIGVIPPAEAGNDVTLHLEVADVDGLVVSAAAAGATVDRPPGDTPYGRLAVIRDPFGHRWMLNRRAASNP